MAERPDQDMNPVPEIILIAALAEGNRVIGDRGQIPWHLPADLKRFRQLTTGHPVIMGRHTWEQSLNRRVLPQRWNVVVSSTLSASDCPDLSSQTGGDSQTRWDLVRSLPAAFVLVQHEPQIYIIGGASIYEQTFHLAHRLELTIVEGHYEGDAVFPDYRPLIGQRFQQVGCDRHPGLRFETYRLHPTAICI
ncbi:MAG: dihydrofolate reductase [Synechococcales bacterium]|nr:dihydrofolate reductase [Synechococcales bacterium]